MKLMTNLSKIRRVGHRWLGPILAVVACSSGPTSVEDPLNIEWVTITYGQGRSVPVAVQRPENSTSGAQYPVVIALPWGSGTQDLVLGIVATYWNEEAPARGYIVVSPAIVGPSLETEGEFIPALFAWMDQNLSYDQGRVVLTGASNGGRGVFLAAAAAPESFAAFIGMPGEFTGDGSALAGLAGKPVWLMVGENDAGWRQAAQTTRDLLVSQGASVRLDVLAGQGHVLTIPQTDLMDWIDDALDSGAGPGA